MLQQQPWKLMTAGGGNSKNICTGTGELKMHTCKRSRSHSTPRVILGTLPYRNRESCPRICVHVHFGISSIVLPICRGRSWVLDWCSELVSSASFRHLGNYKNSIVLEHILQPCGASPLLVLSLLFFSQENAQIDSICYAFSNHHACSNQSGSVRSWVSNCTFE